MNYYETISHGYRFGRVFDDRVEEYMPDDLRPLVQYLVREHGMELIGIFLENYKAPDRIVVMSGALPMDDLRRLPESDGLRFTEWRVESDKNFASLEGAPRIRP